ncbi:MAG: FAD-dependent oxidoreductase [Myxococcales bacterium]
MSRLVVLGAGQAGMQLAATARAEGFPGDIVLVGEEPLLPYRRPPLSKEYLAGKATAEQLLLRASGFYREQRIETRLNLRAERIDRANQEVLFTDGSRLAYSALALTMGTRVKQLPVPGAELAGVHYVRSAADVERLQHGLSEARSAVVIGGGFVGLETAAVLRGLGVGVCLLEMQDRIMPRVVSPLLSEFYRNVHSQRGVEVVTGAGVTRIERRNAGGLAVHCADGREFTGDIVVVGIGVVPNQELAAAAGLTCDDGIVVDEFARTSDPHIVAAGDCTYHPNPLLERSLRLESVHNAVAQATTAALTVCGKPSAYAQFPWFWSDQYEYKLQMVGLSHGYDQEVVRGNLETGKFSLFYFRQGRLLAVDSVNAANEHITCKRLLAAGRSPTREQAEDAQFDLKRLI